MRSPRKSVPTNLSRTRAFLRAGVWIATLALLAAPITSSASIVINFGEYPVGTVLAGQTFTGPNGTATLNATPSGSARIIDAPIASTWAQIAPPYASVDAGGVLVGTVTVPNPLMYWSGISFGVSTINPWAPSVGINGYLRIFDASGVPWGVQEIRLLSYDGLGEARVGVIFSLTPRNTFRIEMDPSLGPVAIDNINLTIAPVPAPPTLLAVLPVFLAARRRRRCKISC